MTGADRACNVAVAPPVNWQSLHRAISECPWSTEARAAGMWAIAELSEQLGPHWPRAWRRVDAGPPELMCCWYSLAGYAATLELTLCLHRLRNTAGVRSLRDVLKGTTRPAALMSPRLQMRVGAVSASLGIGVELEPTLSSAESPADLLLESETARCTVEVLAAMRDERTLDADAWLQTIDDRLRAIGVRHGVDFEGAVRSPLDEQATEDLLDELECRAHAYAAGLQLPPLERPEATLRVKHAGSSGGGSSFDLPRIDYARRIRDKLQAKVEQTARSRAGWLLVDWLDHLWHMTAWGARPFAEKASDLSGLLREVLLDARHLRGIVFTDGAVLMRPDVPEETHEMSGGAFALSRQVDRWHTRESLIVPLRAGATAEAALWQAVFDAERGWVGRELERIGLQAPPELFGARTRPLV